MGTWSTGILDNDTARDLLPEYSVAFWKYPVPEALARLDAFVRQDYDEGDSEEWANYRYSLADFLWKKGILPDEVRSHTVAMIDSGFGLELWAEAGEKALRARQRALAAFREKLLSPLPPRKTIKPHVHTQRIFRDGDLVAIQLQTAGKPYTGGKKRPMTDEEFHACDGNMCCFSSSAAKPAGPPLWTRRSKTIGPSSASLRGCTIRRPVRSMWSS